MARAWHLERRPHGMPVAEDFALRDIDLPPLAEGQIRIRNLWLSVDPYMRGRMNDVKSYAAPFALGEPMTGGAVGEVVESRAEGFAPGDRVTHMAGWRDEAVQTAREVQKLPQLDAPPQAFLGQFGMPGMTAYFGLLRVAEAQSGETVFVSAAAGAVGSTVVQIARARGMTVIGSAGGAAKGEQVRDRPTHQDFTPWFRSNWISFIGGFSGGVEGGISVPVSALKGDFRGTQLYASASFTQLLGLGAFVGGGNNLGGGYTSSPIQTGTSMSLVLQGGAAVKAGGEVQVELGSSPGISGGAGPRVGYGAYAAGGVKHAATAATPELCY